MVKLFFHNDIHCPTLTVTIHPVEMRRQQSAYFPDAEDSSIAAAMESRRGGHMTNKAPSGGEGSTMHAGSAIPMHMSSGISFPFNQSVLWSREVIGFPSFLKAQDVIQALYLSSMDVSHLLHQLSLGCGVDFSVAVVQHKALSDNDKASLGSPFLGVPEYMLVVSRDSDISRNQSYPAAVSSSNLTVPIGCRSTYDDRITFDEDATR